MTMAECTSLRLMYDRCKLVDDVLDIARKTMLAGGAWPTGNLVIDAAVENRLINIDMVRTDLASLAEQIDAAIQPQLGVQRPPKEFTAAPWGRPYP